MQTIEKDIPAGTYLLGKTDIKQLEDDGTVSEIDDAIGKKLQSLKKKEIGMLSKGLVVTDSNNKIVYKEGSSHLQHFFPNLIRDFAFLAYEYARFKKPLPIISVDSHDVIGCDFRCLDCLSGNGMYVAHSEVNNGFEPPLDRYLHILSEIAAYSKKRGVESVRFEQSGEGNPDFYKYRPELIKEAKERYGMDTVYITTGSMMSEALMQSLVKYAAFIRISFPGIDQRTYGLYSRNERYTFNDSIERLKKLVEIRKQVGREKELLIGVRVALRPEEDPLYYDFGKLIKSIGVDCIQVVKILAPTGLPFKSHPVSQLCKDQLAALKSLENEDFNIALPSVLDYMYYERIIENMDDFPSKCYSSLIQPVLTGSGLFVCTKSDVMYSTKYRFGDFKGDAGELEQFMSKENVERVEKYIPETCTTCGNIFDNMLFGNVVKLANKTNEPLSFYEVIEIGRATNKLQ
jgi:wyosine [tRNA(Phe)-imidazoG37] synthetase (radical SAM superfamily)